MTGIYDMAMQGLQIADQGRERKKQRTLAELVGKAYQSEGPERQQYIGQAIGMDPDAGFAAQGHFRQMDEDMRSQVARHAQVFTSLPDEQKAAMYPQLAAEVRKVTGVNVPDVYDAKFLPMIQRLGGVSAGEGYTLGPGARRFDANNQLVAESPFAPANLQLASVATGDGGTQQMQYNPRSGALSPLLSGGAQGVQDVIRNLAGQYDGQITSMVRTPEHNREVGGVPNSQHIRGTAGDVVIRDPQMRKAYMEAAKGMGLSVIDEGDHLHTQLPRGTQIAQSGPLGYTPPKSETQNDLDKRIGMARAMGASEEEIKRLVLGQSAPSTRDALGGKPLTQGTVNALTKDAGRLDNLLSLSSQFADEFAGNRITGGAENLLGRLGVPGVTEGQAEWWQQYDRMKNEVRNELFGASLTTSEQAAFKAADIDPSMSPAVIRKNLAAQQKIIKSALERKAKTWAAQGYNRDAIREATGIDLADAPKEQAPQNSSIDALLDKYK